MKVLFLPLNVASIPSISAEAINKKKGVESICISQQLHQYHAKSPQVKYLPLHSWKTNPLLWLMDQFFYKRKIKKWIKWADVIHYTWGTALDQGEDLAWAKEYDKPVFIEFVGSELRNPDLLQAVNPYYKRAWLEGYEYKGLENTTRALSLQRLFAKYGAIPIVCPEMSFFLTASLFKEQHCVFQRMNVKEFVPAYPSLTKKKILVVHSPTAQIAKGSKYIIQAIETLQQEFEFDFKLLQNMPRSVVLEWMTKADIFIDQLILGSYGMASIEAMSFGKPVLCYIMPQLVEYGLPQDCPIVNANPDTLKKELTSLIVNPELRNRIGVKSREYAEKYHDSDVIAEQLIGIYRSAIETKKIINEL